MNSIANVLGEALLGIAFDGSRQIVRCLIDLLGGGENFLRRLLARLHRGVKFMSEPAHWRVGGCGPIGPCVLRTD